MITLVLAMCIGIMIGTVFNCAFDKELDKLADFMIYKYKEFKARADNGRVSLDQGINNDYSSEEKLSA